MLNGRMPSSVPTSSQRQMLTDTVTVGSWTAAAKAIGALKIVIAARLFGTGDAMDAYLIAFLIPSFIADVLAAPLDTVLVPILVRRRDQEGPGAAETLYSQVLIAVVVLLSCVALIALAASSFLLPLLGSSFHAEKLAYTQFLFVAMLPMVPMSGFWVAARAVLNSERRFALSAGLPMITPILSIAILLAGGRRWGVTALAVATTAGVFLQAAVCVVAAWLAGFRLRGVWTGAGEVMRLVGGQYLPVVSMSLLMGSSALIDQAMAARLSPGSASAFNYGTRLTAVLMALGPLAIGTAVLPNISKLIAAGATADAYGILRRYAAITAAASAALVALLMVISEPLVRIVVGGGGAFDNAGIRLVSTIQSVSLLQVPIAILLAIGFRLVSAQLANQALYGVAIAAVVLTVLFDVTLMHWMGLVGLAVAATCTRSVLALYLFCKIRGLRPADMAKSTSHPLS